MGLNLINKGSLNSYIKGQSNKIEKALIYQMEYLVAKLENHAKLSAGYQDQTANLKSSIGGVVLRNRQPISYKGFTGANWGVSKGKEFINELSSEMNNGYVILLVAGMQYATYVEDHHNLNVLKQSELLMDRELPIIIEKLKLQANKGL